MKKKKPYIVLLRGVMPTGKNRIPKMSFLQEILSTEFDSVRTYIQSGNIVLISDRSRSEIAKKVFELIKKHIGPELSSIVVTREEIQEILDKNPFMVQELRDKSSYLASKLDKTRNTDSPIISIPVDFQHCYEVARTCQENGVRVFPVTYPAVSKNKSRIRLFVSRLHTYEDLDFAAETIQNMLYRI